MSTGVELVRQEWAEGYRRFESAREEPTRYRALNVQLDSITEQLRRRVGASFLLDELVAEYRRSDSWTIQLLVDLPDYARWAPGLTTATDAAFHLYARGAQDYRP
ncbi:MAG: hypothetical protein ACM3QU_13820 [Verrucomicrobiota bacterium]